MLILYTVSMLFLRRVMKNLDVNQIRKERRTILVSYLLIVICILCQIITDLMIHPFWESGFPEYWKMSLVLCI